MCADMEEAGQRSGEVKSFEWKIPIIRKLNYWDLILYQAMINDEIVTILLATISRPCHRKEA